MSLKKKKERGNKKSKNSNFGLRQPKGLSPEITFALLRKQQLFCQKPSKYASKLIFFVKIFVYLNFLL